MKVVALLFFLLIVPVARAHEWYDARCCSGRDCHPVADHTVRGSKAGYTVTLQPGEHPLVKDKPVSGFVPYAEALVSRDRKFHACIVNRELKCLYAPQGGV